MHTAQHLTQHYPAKRQSHVHRANEPMLTAIYDAGPTLKQHWVNVLRSPGKLNVIESDILRDRFGFQWHYQ